MQKILTVFGILIVALGVINAQGGAEMVTPGAKLSFQAYNYHQSKSDDGWWYLHSNAHVYHYVKYRDQNQKKQMTFNIRKGYAGDNTVSFDAQTWPTGYQIRLNGYWHYRYGGVSTSGTAAQDASFHVRDGLAGEGASFESVRHKNYFICQYSDRSYLKVRAENDNYYKECTWMVHIGLAELDKDKLSAELELLKDGNIVMLENQ